MESEKQRCRSNNDFGGLKRRFQNMIKMIAMDFDWTIIDHSKEKLDERVGCEFIDEMNRFIKNGNHAGIVSGRMFGAFEFEMKAMRVDWANPFPDFLVAREAYIYQLKNNEYIEEKEYNVDMNSRIMRFNRKIAHHMDDILDLCKNEGINVTNFITYGDFASEISVKEEDADRAMELVQHYINSNFEDGAVHRNCTAITVYYKPAGKGNTLLQVARIFGLKPCEILAIGDNYNDISMIDSKLGFIGGCVGNAEENIKKIVKAGGGYVGDGIAFRGVLDILKQARKDGLLE